MNVVLTHLLTGVPDPQRGRRWKPDPGIVGALRESVERHGHQLVVLTDCLTEGSDTLGVGAGWTTFVRVPPGGSPYWYRWDLSASWLGAHPDVLWAWCVDASDVEMLNDPFPHMRPGLLYAGSEERTLGHPGSRDWIVKGDPSVAEWVDARPGLPVLNMGTLGGHRDMVLEAAEALTARNHGQPWELGAFQQIGYEQFAGRLVTGPMVHTRFLAQEHDSLAWWRHK